MLTTATYEGRCTYVKGLINVEASASSSMPIAYMETKCTGDTDLAL